MHVWLLLRNWSWSGTYSLNFFSKQKNRTSQTFRCSFRISLCISLAPYIYINLSLTISFFFTVLTRSLCAFLFTPLIYLFRTSPPIFLSFLFSFASPHRLVIILYYVPLDLFHLFFHIVSNDSCDELKIDKR